MPDWKSRFGAAIKEAYSKLQTIGQQHASLTYRPAVGPPGSKFCHA